MEPLSGKGGPSHRDFIDIVIKKEEEREDLLGDFQESPLFVTKQEKEEHAGERKCYGLYTIQWAQVHLGCVCVSFWSGNCV